MSSLLGLGSLLGFALSLCRRNRRVQLAHSGRKAFTRRLRDPVLAVQSGGRAAHLLEAHAQLRRDCALTLQVLRGFLERRIEPHPFIQPAPETRRIDWVISPDRQWIAWTLANQTGEGLQTITTLARADGTSPRVILTDGPDTFLRVMPLALTPTTTSRLLTRSRAIERVPSSKLSSTPSCLF